VSRLSRELRFARNVPPRQIGRRAWLRLRREVEGVLKPRLPARRLPLAEDAPAPVFAPRQGLVSHHSDEWEFHFVGRTLRTGGEIDWAAASREPGSQLWRMNLHYMEWLEGLGTTDLQGAIEDWIDANPRYRPGAESDAWNAYALSIRAVVWMQQFALRRGEIEAGWLEGPARALAQQLLFLERHLETDVGGNHLLKNLKALLWGSAFFGGAVAERWRRKALRLLSRQLAHQFLPDGMHFELSPAYHCQVFADLLEIRHALREDPLDGRIDAVLGRAAQAIADLSHPDGQVAQFGDAGLTMAYSPAECRAAYQACFGRAPGPRPIFAFPEAGYFGARAAQDYVVIDAGPIAPLELPAHGHGDIMSFEWSLDGQRIVVDQGVYEYVAGPKREESRTAASHNTLWVEGADQAEFFGSFRCGRRARVTVLRHQVLGDGFLLEACHDGYRRSGGAVHFRRAELSPRRLRIADRLDGPLDRPGRVSLLLHPEVAADQLATGKIRLTCGKTEALVSGSLGLRVEPATWWPDMGVERPTLRLIMDWPRGTRESVLELSGTPEGEVELEAD